MQRFALRVETLPGQCTQLDEYMSWYDEILPEMSTVMELPDIYNYMVLIIGEEFFDCNECESIEKAAAVKASNQFADK